ncbi:YbaK/EbsC family protein [Streptomyces boncukensis]|uniref:YbaK/EbsC family protein n=1 Tax=Streptomyces boncukensis TaxID=2711219 RepID=A0A6G4WSW5_9ACTN|nr:YbaK/EbsC family protein [Streptomyces boncukensis]NGO68295.1 YbaK/EbsC family protein [Streptomyces boncukensis]
MTEQHPENAAAHPRFAKALATLGLADVEVRTFPEATRTAQQAADAIGCRLSQIVKSLVFQAGEDRPLLVLMDGSSRVDLDRVRAALGAGDPVRRADAAAVRAATGYAIGGVPPFGHVTPLRVLADRGLLAHDVVWAAAGTPHTVFPLPPGKLVEYARGTLVDVREATGGDTA